MATSLSEVWAAVDRLVDRHERLDDLRTHRIHLLAARRWRAAGRPVPAEIRLDERRSVVAALAAPVLLRRVREAYDGPLIVLKGPEVAAHYPDPALRPYGDLDLLVPDPHDAQRALAAAGFVALGDPRFYENIHHQRPMAVHGLPLSVELHSMPKWPDGFAPPRTEELFEAAIPASLGVDGLGTLSRAQHALVLAAHSWAHDPLRRVGELVDIAAMSHGLDSGELRSLAARWGLRGIWDATAAAAGALLEGRGTSLPLRTWARHLPAVRDRTVLESHLERWLSMFWSLPPRKALVEVGGVLARELRPAPGETPSAKLSRARLAVRNARVSHANH
ncbi:MAG TPA: nucleotidyltransferase family protein, partial [Solirubrobacteraceae bacterium]|nr:nucleotidyltransferase family protein [Solirubrobacteraceae bacterium]